MKTEFSLEYHTEWGEELVLVASDVRYPMSWNDGDIWTVTLPKATKAILSDYSYIVVKDGRTIRTEWEHHSAAPASKIADRWIDKPERACLFNRKHDFAPFDEPGYRGAGTAIPVFSLRSGDDFGVGEFLDLMKLVDWAAETGQSIIQLLPINDTTRTGTFLDSYPYNPVTSFALHPQYINLQAVGIKADAAFRKQQKALNALSTVDYEAVNRIKINLLRSHFAEKGAKDLAGAAYRKFEKANAYWLTPYAEFCSRRDGNVTADFYRWVQFHLDKQLSSVCRYAHSKGVVLKGDLPIGVSADSVDAYTNPALFNLDSQAGAPPDYFSADGQNWGFPTYNWEEMAKDDYGWWKSRLRKMSEYFSAFRIDHILGFFRIWEIPTQYKSGKMGHFNPALAYTRDEIASKGLPVEGLFLDDPRNPGRVQPMISPDTSALSDWQKGVFGDLYNDFFYHRNDGFWKDKAERKLPALLGATGMLACGEDLGMVPDCVPEVMWNEKILSLEIQRMPKQSWMEYGRPEKNPYLSVCATSTHDMSPLRMWWDSEMDQGQRNHFYNAFLGREGEAPAVCTGEIAEQIVAWHLYSPSMLTILPLQDWTAIDENLRNPDPLSERINDPANPRHYWRYRMHMTLETLLGSTGFNEKVRSLVKGSGR